MGLLQPASAVHSSQPTFHLYGTAGPLCRFSSTRGRRLGDRDKALYPSPRFALLILSHTAKSFCAFEVWNLSEAVCTILQQLFLATSPFDASPVTLQLCAYHKCASSTDRPQIDPPSTQHYPCRHIIRCSSLCLILFHYTPRHPARSSLSGRMGCVQRSQRFCAPSRCLRSGCRESVGIRLLIMATSVQQGSQFPKPMAMLSPVDSRHLHSPQTPQQANCTCCARDTSR